MLFKGRPCGCVLSFLSRFAKKPVLWCVALPGNPGSQHRASLPFVHHCAGTHPPVRAQDGQAHHRGPSWLPHDPARGGVVLRSDGQPRPLLKKHAKNFTIRTILTSQQKGWWRLDLPGKSIEINSFIDIRNWSDDKMHSTPVIQSLGYHRQRASTGPLTDKTPTNAMSGCD